MRGEGGQCVERKWGASLSSLILHFLFILQKYAATYPHPLPIHTTCSFLFSGVSTDAVFKDMKDVQALANTATEEITALAEKKKKEIETA